MAAPVAAAAAAAGVARLGAGLAKLDSGIAMFRDIAEAIAAVVTTVNGATAAFDRFGGAGKSSAAAIVTGFAAEVPKVAASAESAGDFAGKSFTSRLKSPLMAGLKGIGAAAKGVLGNSFGQLEGVDTAQAKLRGLGQDVNSIKSIMGSANAAIKGTSYGIGDAASVAASAIAAGIKPGQQLESMLKGVANVATATGSTMAETSAVFNRVAEAGRAYGTDIDEIAGKGIPIWEALAKQLGVTTDEVRSMAAQGQIDFATFQAAASEAAGGIADEMGKTVPGAMKNLKGLLSGLGEKAFGGLYTKLGPLIAAVVAALGPLQAKAQAFGDLLVKWLGPAIDRITGILNAVGAGTLTASGAFTSLMSVLGPLGGMLAVMVAPVGLATAALSGLFLSGAMASSLVQTVTDAIGKIVAELPGFIATIAQVVPRIVAVLLGALPMFLEAGSRIVTALVEGLVAVLPALVLGGLELVNGLVAAIIASLPMLITAAVGLVQALLEGIVVALPLLIEGGLQLLNGLLAGIVQSLPVLIQAATMLVQALIEGLIIALPALVEGALALATGLLDALLLNLPLIIEGGMQLLMALVAGLVQALPMLGDAVLQLVGGLLSAIVTNLPQIISAGMQILNSLVDGLVQMLPQLIQAAVNLIIQLVEGLLRMLPQLIEAGVHLVIALIQGLVQAIPKIIAMIPQIVRSIWDTLTKVNWLDLGVQIVKGIINGLGSMAGAIVEAIVGLAKGAFQAFKDFFGIKSPARLMIQPGRDVVRGAVVGVQDEDASFGDSLVGMARDAAQRAQGAMANVAAAFTADGASPGGSALAAGGPTGDVSIPVQINMYDRDPRIVARQVGREIAGRLYV